MDEQLRCLIIEDSHLIRQLIAYVLSKIDNINIEIDEAENGVEGLKKITSKKYDLFFTDINMPLMDGLKLIHRIRDDSVHSKVPIVVITTEKGKEDMEKAIKLGANAYLVKPITEEEIYNITLKLLNLIKSKQ